jgi:hypothetical protein
MTKSEFDEKLKEIENEKNKKVNQLMTQYALDNNTYKIGDIIENSSGTKIIIEIIKVAFVLMSNYSECLYYGPKLKKNGDRFKSGEYADVYQRDIIS